jgi:hypothetical protein
MTGEQAANVRTSDAAIEAAHAIYTPLMLSVYDRLVHGLSNRFAWRCPTQRMLDLYRSNLSSRHLEPGVGTGFFIDWADREGFEQLTLLDINRHCLARSARRLERYQPLLCEANLLAPIAIELEPADSIGLTYVLHCLPGRMAEKLKAIDHASGHERGRSSVRGDDPRSRHRAERRRAISAAAL